MNGVELRPIPGIIGYAAGDDGNVYSFRSAGCRKGRKALYTRSPKLMRAKRERNGYLRLSLRWRGRQWHSVHRLVCSAFHGPCPKGMQCSHLDGDQTNNRPENLRWETPKKNIRRRREHGTSLDGSKNHNAILNEEVVREMRRMRNLGISTRDIARRFGVHQATASHAITGRSWSHV